MNKDDTKAFPSKSPKNDLEAMYDERGLELRDYFASDIVSGIMSNEGLLVDIKSEIQQGKKWEDLVVKEEEIYREVARRGYMLADIMIEVRKGNDKQNES